VAVVVKEGEVESASHVEVELGVVSEWGKEEKTTNVNSTETVVSTCYDHASAEQLACLLSLH
jgi:hypothetical protein